MPVTRSRGRAPEWSADIEEVIINPATTHQQQPSQLSSGAPIVSTEPPPPSTSSTIENRNSRRLRQRESDSAHTASPDEHVSRELRAAGTISSNRNRSNRKALKARQDLLKIQLQLAEIALQQAEESQESDSYAEEGNSQAGYVRSWLKEVPNPPVNREQIEAAADKSNHVAPNPHVDSEHHVAPNPRVDSELIEQDHVHTATQLFGIEKETHRIAEETNKVCSSDSDSMRSLLTGLTSAIAALAEKKTPDTTHPVASKVIMTLPTFDGAHTEWLSFQAIYDTTKNYFNDVENTARLRRSLIGRALEAVNSELIAHARPSEIMKELALQFGRPDSIAQAESDRMKNLPRCGETPREICTFAGKIRSGVVTLEALKKEHYLINAELLRILTEKLPNSLRVQWYRIYTEKYNSVPNLRNFSEFVTENAKYCSAFASADNSETHNRRNFQRAHTAIEQQRAHTVNERSFNSSRNTSSIYNCKICEKAAHHPANCEEFNRNDSNKKWDLAKQYGLCFRCLHIRNKTHSCKPRKCGIDGCAATHHRLLHYLKKQSDDGSTDKQEVVANSKVNNSRAFLKIVPVRLIGPAGEVSTFALLDDGSTVSLIDKEIADSVGADGRLEPFTVHTIGEEPLNMRNSRRVNVTVKTMSGKVTPLSLRTVPRLSLMPQEVKKEDIEGCAHLSDIASQLVYEKGEPKILIGQDNWHLLVANKTRRGNRNQPIASLTALGWVLHGLRPRGQVDSAVHFVGQITNIERIEKNSYQPNKNLKNNSEGIVKSNQKIKDGHSKTIQPCKKDNFISSHKSIERKLHRNAQIKPTYRNEIDSNNKKEYARRAPLNSTPSKSWYFPHDFRFHRKGPDLSNKKRKFCRQHIAVTPNISEQRRKVRVRAKNSNTQRRLTFSWSRSHPEELSKEKTMLAVGTPSYQSHINMYKKYVIDAAINKHYNG